MSGRLTDGASDLMLVYTLSLVIVGIVIGAGTAQGAVTMPIGFALAVGTVAVWFGIWRRVIRG